MRKGRKDLKNVKPFTIYLSDAHLEKLETLIETETEARGKLTAISKSDYIRTLIERQPTKKKP